MRIIAGSAKRREIKVPKALVRPTTDRTREAMFSMISSFLPHARVLDIFAGSGALGLEALSRGAQSCDFVELHKSCAQIVEDNIKNLRLKGGSVILADALKFITRTVQPYDLIFADPPYWKQQGDFDFVAELLKKAQNSLTPDGLCVIEVSKHYTLNVPPAWQKIDERVYGSCKVIFLQHNEQSQNEE